MPKSVGNRLRPGGTTLDPGSPRQHGRSTIVAGCPQTAPGSLQGDRSVCCQDDYVLRSQRFLIMNSLPVIDSPCEGCGDCCLWAGRPPFLECDNDLARLPRPLQVEVHHTPQQWHGKRPCIWLDTETRRCRHYEHRPIICREFEAGGPGCRSVRDNNRRGERRSAGDRRAGDKTFPG